MRFLIGLSLLALAGCATKQPAVSQAIPETTAQACSAIRGFLGTDQKVQVTSQESPTECHMRFTADERHWSRLNKHLEKTGWKRDPTYGKGASLPKSAWETSSTRCTVNQAIPETSGSPVRGAIGVSGGSHVATGFGVGIGMGADEPILVDYQIDCLPKKPVPSTGK